MIRRHARIRGVVQGVGFRPFAHGLAMRLGLTGRVGNDASGAWLEVQGPPAGVAEFFQELRDHPPTLARLTSWN